MVVGLLGVLKAGGAYVPLDPAFPPARIAFMLDDAGVAVLLTEPEPPRVAARRRGRRSSASTRTGDGDDGRPDTPPAVAVSPENLAYVIYTSGSTGTAQGGAGHPRRPGELPLADAAPTGLRPGPGRAPVALPALVRHRRPELLLPLAVGARVELAGREGPADERAGRRPLAGRGSDYSLLQATPAHLAAARRRAAGRPRPPG